MTRVFLFSVLAAVALTLAMGMGSAAVVAQDQANETSNATAVEWPTDPENVTVEDARDALEEQPDDLPRESVTAIAEWVSDRDNLEELGASERDRLAGWMLEARSVDPNLPDVPDLDRDRSDGDREDRPDQASDDDEGEPPAEDEPAAENETVNQSENMIETRAGYEEPVDEHVTISEWTYDVDRERFTIVLEVNESTRVSMTEVVSQEEASSGSLSVFQDRLGEGRHEIEIAASPGASGEAQVVISTPRSVRNGEATFVSTGYVPQELPFERTNPTAGWIGGSVTTIAMIGAAAYRRKHKDHDPVVVCE